MTELLFAFAALAGLIVIAAAWNWRSGVAAFDALTVRAQAARPAPAPSHAFADLPPPVRRYLDNALPADRRGLWLARYAQKGRLRTDPMRDRWLPFTASQAMSPGTAEFLWRARVRIAPLLHVQVTDSLLEGVGAGGVALLSAVPVASSAGGEAMDSGSLHRFLAEAVWCPSALLPSARLSWRPIDDTRALATLRQGSRAVSLEFRFDACDQVSGIYTPARWGRFGDRFEQRGWEGRFARYARHEGVLVPTAGEVGWHLQDAWRPVWQGEITAVDLRFQ